MSRTPFTNAGAVNCDGDVVDIVGATPGPAGIAVVELPDGTSLRVDYADPRVLVELSTTTAAALDGTVLRDLIGPDSADRVAAVVREGRTGTRRIPGVSSPRYRGSPTGSPLPGDDVPPTGRAAVLLERCTDPDRPDVERAAAALDLAVLVDRAHLPETVRRPLQHTVDAAAEVIAESADELVALAEVDPALASVLRRVHGHRLPDAVRDGLEIPLFAASGPPPGLAPMRLEAAGINYLRSAPPPSREPRTGPPSIVDVDGAFWIVECEPANGATTRWIRVLDADLVVVAAAPVTEDRGVGGRADVLVPEYVTPATATIEVTTEPFPVPPAGLDAIAAAVRAGRRAADLEQAGQRRAAAAWEQCADRWQRLGDIERSRAARRFAWRARRGRSIDEIAGGDSPVTDLVTASRP